MSNEIYQNNLSVLKERFPELYSQWQHVSNNFPFTVESFTTECGQANVLVTLEDGRQVALYEAQDIVSSAEAAMAQWQSEAQDILFFIGIGLGYYPLTAAKIFSSRPTIVIIERCPAVFDLALKSVDLTALLNYEQLDLIVGNGFKATDIINHYKRHIFIGKQRVITHMPSRKILGETVEVLERELQEHLSLTKDIWKTNLETGKEMLSNLMANLPSLAAGVSIDKMQGIFSGMPVLCVSAGPSLDESVAAIKKLQDKILIVALDSAVSTLIPAGIKPHLVVTCDTRRSNFEKIRPYLSQLRHSILVFALESNPDNVRVFPGPQRLAVASDNLFITSWLGPALNIDCNLPAMSTVSHTAIFSMMALGADPIIVVGMDMAFPDNKSHAKNVVNRYSGMPASEFMEVDGTNGLQVRTYRPMIDYARQLENVIADSPHRFVNSCLTGMLIEGMEIKSLQEAAETELDFGLDINQRLAILDWERQLSATTLLSNLKEKRQELEQYRDQCQSGIQKTEFLLNCFQNNESGIDFANAAEKIQKFHEQFQKENDDLTQLLFSIRLEEIREMEVDLLNLQRDSADTNDRLKTMKELQVIKDNLISLREAASFFGHLIAEREDFWLNVDTLKNDIEMDPDNQSKQLKLADTYSAAGEIMLADCLYGQIIQKAPGNVRYRLKHARLYADAKLWGQARDLIQKTRLAFPDDSEVNALKDNIEKEISNIRENFKQAWTQGETARTRRLLNEYLFLCPEDEGANRIQSTIMEMEIGIAPDLPPHGKDELSSQQFEHLLIQAGECLRSLEFEKAVGTIEGLIANYPHNTAELREKIGDIRMLQQDYPSAVWNYKQVLKILPRAPEIEAKVNRAGQELEKVKTDCIHPVFNIA